MRVYKHQPAIERFLTKIRINNQTGCWEWTATLAGAGYGIFYRGEIGKPRFHYAHRFAYEHFVGPIPKGKEIDHLCRVRHCANPEHLRVVSHRENMLCGETIAARNASVTHCVQGHEYTAKNTRLGKDGSRSCRDCDSFYRHRNRAKSVSR